MKWIAASDVWGDEFLMHHEKRHRYALAEGDANDRLTGYCREGVIARKAFAQGFVLAVRPGRPR